MTFVNYPNVISNSIHWFANPYAFLDGAQAKHGLTFRIALPGLGSPLLTGDPQLIREIAANKSLVGGKGIHSMRSLFGSESLIMLQGETHQKHRRMLTTPFRKPELACHDDFTVETTLEVLRGLPFEQPFSMFEVAQKINQIMIIRLVFGKMTLDQESEALELLHAFMTSFQNPLILFLRPLHINLGTHSPWGRVVRNRQRIWDFIHYQVMTFRQTPDNVHSVLAHLLTYPDISEQEVVNIVSSLLFFGSDTTSATLAWAFAHIYNCPEALTRLKDEAFSETSFIQACINESMRLCPIVVQTFRMAEQDVTIAGHLIRKDEMVIPCLYLAHRNPAVFAKPQFFLPERFMNGDTFLNSFFPYGFGARLCVGKSLAQQQMPLILSTILKNINLTLAPGYIPTPVRYMFFIAPRDGTLMVRKR